MITCSSSHLIQKQHAKKQVRKIETYEQLEENRRSPPNMYDETL